MSVIPASTNTRLLTDIGDFIADSFQYCEFPFVSNDGGSLLESLLSGKLDTTL